MLSYRGWGVKINGLLQIFYNLFYEIHSINSVHVALIKLSGKGFEDEESKD